MSESAAPLSVALVITGALLMAAKGIIAKLLYHAGVTLEALLVLRAVMALPLIWGWAWWRGELPRVWQAPKATLAIAMLGGLSGYYLGTWCDFRGLELIDASLERVLLFTYPAIVVLVRALWRRRAPSAREATAVVLTWVGVVLAVGGFDLALWRANGHGALLVLASAALFSGYLFANEHVGKRIGSVGFMVVAATSAALSPLASARSIRSSSARKAAAAASDASRLSSRMPAQRSGDDPPTRVVSRSPVPW